MRHPRETTSSRPTSHYCVRFVQTKPFFVLPTPAMLKCSRPLFRHVPKWKWKERWRYLKWIHGFLFITLHQLKGCLLSNGISWQTKGTKAKWHWHRRNEEKQKASTVTQTHTHTYTVALLGFKPRASLTWHRATVKEKTLTRRSWGKSPKAQQWSSRELN